MGISKRLVVLRDIKVIYVPFYRSCTTSVTIAIATRYGIATRPPEHPFHDQEFVNRLVVQYAPGDWNLEKYRGYTIVCVCRNPYSRFRSSYMWYGAEATPKGWSRPLSQKTFEDRVRSGATGTNKHVSPQTGSIAPLDDPRCRVFKVEDGLKPLKDILGVEIPKVHESRDYPYGIFAQFKFTTETIQLINQVYAQDFAVFGYSMVRTREALLERYGLIT